MEILPTHISLQMFRVSVGRELCYKTRGNLESFAESTARSRRYISSTAQKQTRSQGPSVLLADLCGRQANNRPWVGSSPEVKSVPWTQTNSCSQNSLLSTEPQLAPASLPLSCLASVLLPKPSFENIGWIFQELPVAQSEDQTC